MAGMDELVVRVAWAPGWERMTPRAREAICGVVVHRIEVSQEDSSYGDTAEEVARFFREHPVGVKATGGEMPYPLLIDAEGIITQTVPLLRVTPHARAHNPTTIGVGCIGDFRARQPSPVQHRSLLRLCAHLVRELRLSASALRGHDELAGGSADPDKICPGEGLSPTRLREDVERLAGEPQPTLALVW